MLCVRDIRSIIHALERDRIADPFCAVSNEFANGEQTRFATIEQRTAAYLQTGALYAPLHAAYNIIQSGRMRDLFVIRYEDFARTPRATLSLLYAKLNLPEFAHQFETLVEFKADPFTARTLHAGSFEREAPKFTRALSNKVVEGSRWFYEYFYPEELTLRPQNLGHST